MCLERFSLPVLLPCRGEPLLSSRLFEEITSGNMPLCSACDMTVSHRQDITGTSSLYDSFVTDRNDCANNAGKRYRTERGHKNGTTGNMPDRTIIYEDSSMAFCYRHFIPGKRPYYTAVHIPAEKKGGRTYNAASCRDCRSGQTSGTYRI